MGEHTERSRAATAAADARGATPSVDRFEASRARPHTEAEEVRLERCRLLVESFPDSIFWTDHDGRILEISGSPLFDRSIDQLIGEELPDLLPADRALTWLAAARACLADDDGDSRDFELHLVDRRAERWMEARVVRGPDGEIVTMLRDIRERKHLEFELRAGEERFRTLASSAPVGIYRTDVEGRIVYVNDRYCEIFGIACEDAMHPDFISRITHPADLPRIAEQWRRILVEGGSDEQMEPARFRTPAGEIGWVSTQVASFHDRTGAVAGYIGTVWDVTDLKKAEAEKRELERRVQQSQKLESLGLLAGGIAHDFNNLLVAILGGTDLALHSLDAVGSDPSPDPPANPPRVPLRRQLEQVKGAAVRAADLTRQMLAYAGKGRLVIERVDVGELVDEIVHLLEVSLPKTATLALDLEPGIVVEGDPTQLVQVTMNLTTNAAEALEGRPGTIDVRCDTVWIGADDLAALHLSHPIPPGHYAFLEVRDTGHGMDEATRTKIFDPFFSTKFKGRGLGLAAVLGIVRGHRGALEVESSPGAGARFRVLLPTVDGPATRRSREVSDMLDWQGQGTILVVDDEDPVRTVAELMLRQLGFEVLTATDGIDGVQVFKENDQIDLVLMDLTMPRMGGERAFLEMRRIRPGAQVILTSGYTEAEASSRVRDEGVAGFLQKPFELIDLIDRIRAVLGDPSEG